jgi:hypothetical protein
MPRDLSQPEFFAELRSSISRNRTVVVRNCVDLIGRIARQAEEGADPMALSDSSLKGDFSP